MRALPTMMGARAGYAMKWYICRPCYGASGRGFRMLLPLPELTGVVLDATLGRTLTTTQARAARPPQNPPPIPHPPPGPAAPPQVLVVVLGSLLSRAAAHSQFFRLQHAECNRLKHGDGGRPANQLPVSPGRLGQQLSRPCARPLARFRDLRPAQRYRIANCGARASLSVSGGPLHVGI